MDFKVGGKSVHFSEYEFLPELWVSREWKALWKLFKIQAEDKDPLKEKQFLGSAAF